MAGRLAQAKAAGVQRWNALLQFCSADDMLGVEFTLREPVGEALRLRILQDPCPPVVTPRSSGKTTPKVVPVDSDSNTRIDFTMPEWKAALKQTMELGVTLPVATAVDESPLWLCAKAGFITLFLYLVDLGFDPTVRDDAGLRALDAAFLTSCRCVVAFYCFRGKARPSIWSPCLGMIVFR